MPCLAGLGTKGDQINRRESSVISRDIHAAYAARGQDPARISSGMHTASVTVSPPMMNAQLDKPFVHGWAVLLHGSYVVAFAAPPRGMKVCSMNRQLS